MYRPLLVIFNDDVVTMPEVDAFGTYVLLVGLYRRNTGTFYRMEFGFSDRIGGPMTSSVLKINDPDNGDRLISYNPTLIAIRFSTDKRTRPSLRFYE